MATQRTLDGIDEVEQSRMGLGEHLTELRLRLIRSVAVMTVAFLVLYAYRGPVFHKVQEPQQRAMTMLRAVYSEGMQTEFEARIGRGALITPGSDFHHEVGRYFEEGWPKVWKLRDSAGPPVVLTWIQSDGGFFQKMRVCFWLALFVAGPFILWEVWGFIASGLYRNEKRMAYAYFPVSLALFFGGVLFGYFVLIPYALYFLNLDGLWDEGTQTLMEGEYYLGFLKGLSLALGFVFQLPVIMVATARMGLIEPKIFSKYRKHTLVGALVVGAILTPPDPITQLLMAGPIIVLYELGLRVSYLVWKEPLANLDEEDAELGEHAHG